MDDIDIVGVFWMITDVFVLSPFLLYFLYQFYAIRDGEVMTHRKQKIVYFMNILSMIGLLFEQPFNIVVNVWKIHRITLTLKWIMFISGDIFICGIFSLFLCKLWLLYFKKQYHSSLASQTWERQINSRFNSWYVLNKNKWGNDKFILKVILFPLMTFIFIEVIIEQYLFSNVINTHFSILLLSLIFSVPSFIFYWKLKNFYDIFNIDKEIYYQTIVMLIFVIIYFIECSIEITFYYNSNPNYSRICHIISICTASSALFFMSMLSTAYPVYLNKTVSAQNFLMQHISSRSIKTTSKSISSGSSSSKRKRTLIKGMLKVISNYKGFQAFMMHLVEECSTENLFFILELIQMKHEFQMKHNRVLKLPKNMDLGDITPITPEIPCTINEYHTIDFNVGDKNIKHSTDIQNSSTFQMIAASSYIFTGKGKIFCRIKLPVGIPRSELMHLNKYSFQDQLYEIYLKYVKPGSIHEINISYKERTVINEYFKDYKKEKKEENNDDFSDLTKTDNIIKCDSKTYDKKVNLDIDTYSNDRDDSKESKDESDMAIYKLMDGACIEIIRLMFNSYSRFIQTESGEKIIDYIFTNTHSHNNNVSVSIDQVNRKNEHEVIHTDSSYSVLQRQYQLMSQLKK